MREPIRLILRSLAKRGVSKDGGGHQAEYVALDLFAPPRKNLNSPEISGNKRCLFGTRPSLDLPFRCYRIFMPFEPFGKGECDGPSRICISAKAASVVFGDTPFQPKSRSSGVEAVVSTLQDIEVCAPRHARTQKWKAHSSEQLSA
jgi:hypothetical protein